MELVRPGRRSTRRRLSRCIRPRRLQSQSTTAEDRSILDDRQCRAQPGGCRARRLPRIARRSRDHDFGQGRRPGRPRLSRLAQGSQEPPDHPAPLRGLRLCPGPQSRRCRRAMEDRQPANGGLRQGEPFAAGADRRRQSPVVRTVQLVMSVISHPQIFCPVPIRKPEARATRVIAVEKPLTLPTIPIDLLPPGRSNPAEILRTGPRMPWWRSLPADRIVAPPLSRRFRLYPLARPAAPALTRPGTLPPGRKESCTTHKGPSDD
jgi:hypothetical protein